MFWCTFSIRVIKNSTILFEKGCAGGSREGEREERGVKSTRTGGYFWCKKWRYHTRSAPQFRTDKMRPPFTPWMSSSTCWYQIPCTLFRTVHKQQTHPYIKSIYTFSPIEHTHTQLHILISIISCEPWNNWNTRIDVHKSASNQFYLIIQITIDSQYTHKNHKTRSISQTDFFFDSVMKNLNSQKLHKLRSRKMISWQLLSFKYVSIDISTKFA